MKQPDRNDALAPESRAPYPWPQRSKPALADDAPAPSAFDPNPTETRWPEHPIDREYARFAMGRFGE